MRTVISILCFFFFAATAGEWALAQVPDIEVVPDSASFDVIEIGDQRERSFAVSNTDTTETLIVFALDIRGTDADQFQILDGTGGFVLPPRQLNLITVRFAPNSPGNKSAVLLIESNDPDENPLEVSLTGVGRGLPDIDLNQTQLSFGNVVVGSTAFQDLIVINEGFDNLEIEQIQFAGDNFDMFAVEGGNQAVSIGVGEQDTLTVSFTPSSQGSKRGLIRLLSNDPDENTREVELQGFGVRPQIMLDSLSHSYETTTVGDSAIFTFFVSNQGDVDLEIDSLVFRGDGAEHFGVANNIDSLVVRPAETQQLPVKYAPVAAGTHTAILSLLSNDPDRPQVDLSLRGTARASVLGVSSTAIDFGALLTNGLESNGSIVLSNTGAANLVVDSLSIRGADADQFFNFAVNPSNTIRPGEFGEILVVYIPTREGTHEATLNIFTNDPNFRPLVISLSGRSSLLRIQAPEQAELGEDFFVEVNLPEGFEPSEAQLIYRRADSFDFVAADLVGSGAETRGMVPGLAVDISGIEYYVQIKGGSDGFVTLPVSEPEQRPFYVPTVIEQFMPSLSGSAWTHQMISVPIELAEKDVESVLMDDFGPYNTRRWRLFRWEDGDYVEYPEIEGMFEKGVGFWLITNDGASFDIDNGISTDPTIPFELVLQPGWNQIGNPYSYPIDWLGATIDPRIEPPVLYDGLEFQYGQTFLLPWNGYFIRSLAADPLRVSLVRRASGQGKRSGEINEKALYSLQLITEIDGEPLRDSQSFLGLAKESSNDRDAFDLSEAPPIGPFVRTSIIEDGERFVSNFKPVSIDGQFWDLEIDASLDNREVQIHLESEGVLPNDYELFVLDRDQRSTIEIADSTFSINLNQSGTPKKLRVVLGTTQFAEQQRESISVADLEYDLEQNFPNPFSEKTTIRYSLSEQSPVYLDVFNLMGQRVQTLVNMVQEAGNYEILWDGKNENGVAFASGIYLYRIRAGEFTKTHKMLLVR